MAISLDCEKPSTLARSCTLGNTGASPDKYCRVTNPNLMLPADTLCMCTSSSCIQNQRTHSDSEHNLTSPDTF